MKFIFHRNRLRVEKEPVMRPVSQSCHRRSITFPQTVNGQLRNGESFVRFNHPSRVLDAAKCSSTTTLPPVCLTRRDDNRSRPVSADDCVTWNVNNNYAVSSPEACGPDCHSERATGQLGSVAPVDYMFPASPGFRLHTCHFSANYWIELWWRGLKIQYPAVIHARWRLLYGIVYCVIVSRIF